MSTQYGVSTPTGTGGDTPIVGMQHIVDGRVLLRNLPRTSLTSEDLARYRLSDGDVLVNRTNSAVQVGKTGIVVGADRLSAVFASYIIRLNVNPAKAIPEYVNLWMNTTSAVKQLRRLATPGVSQYNINANALKTRFFVPLLPLAEQGKLAAFAARWEDERRTLQATIVAKRRFRRGLIQQLLTGQTRFPQFKISTDLRYTEFGNLPREWSFVRIGDIAREVSLRAGGNHAGPVLACTKHDGLVDSLTYFSRRIFSADTSAYKVVRRGQFAFPANHIEEGSIGLLRDHAEGLVSPIYIVFEPTNRVAPEFLYALFKSDRYRHIFAAATNSSVNRRGSLRWAEFERLGVPLPTMEEQQEIARTVIALDQEILGFQRLADLLTAQKRAVLDKLFSGELRLSGK